jgi:cyclic beta-1,2-glucan synthetase
MPTPSTTDSARLAERRRGDLAVLSALPCWLYGQRARTLVTPAGGGAAWYGELAITRRDEDATSPMDGLIVYLRDLDSGQFWSAGWQPAGGEPEAYALDFGADRACWRRTDFGLQLTSEVVIDGARDVELRRCTLVNKSDRTRTIEITSYLEWVLQDAAADAAHPAFSKLFVETEYLPERRAIVARRRLRDPHQPLLAGAHWIVDGGDDASLEFETSRAAFIGRGQSLRAPAALSARAPLSASTGPVLDPVASLRRDFSLAPDESATIVFALAARPDHSELLPAMAQLTPQLAAAALDRDRATPPTVDRQRGAHAFVTRSGDGLYRIDPAHDGGAVDRFHRLEPSSTSPAPRSTEDEQFRFDNGIGGFTERGDEYVIRLQPRGDGRFVLPPLPWTHVVANPQAGFLATETGAGYTWTVNSRENRLTPWSNDPVVDPHSEALLLRDAERKAYWSLTPGPCGPPVEHQVRYGFGYARYSHTSADLHQQLVQFVPLADPVKASRVTLTNLSGQPRRLDAFYYAQLALGNGAAGNTRHIAAWYDAESQSIFATSSAREASDRVAFAAIVGPAHGATPSFTCDRTEFIGLGGDLADPLAVRTGRPLSGRGAPGVDPCAALEISLRVASGEQVEYWVLLGEAEDEAAARRLIAKYSSTARLDAAFSDVRSFWQEVLQNVQIHTPSPSIDLMVNGWLPYQNISCRLWGRSAYYQSGGAFGFRDQLQDAAALVYHDPRITREQILLHAASQFVEGDVLHWWHPPDSRGIRTRFADDLLWLPLVASQYAETTGDADLWDEQVPYLTGPLLEPHEAERFFIPERSGETGSLYDHCCRAVDRSLAVGAHGLPLMGSGDWNDGMNRVGQGGRGESVWMGFFLYDVLGRMAPVCRARGDQQRAEQYAAHQVRLAAALDDAGWDGQWYRRAYFDDGQPLGTADAPECQIDALVQAWAVLSGAAAPDKARQAIEAVERRLVDRQARLIRLLDPPLDRIAQDPGYIRGYLPGIRENGGQYTHGVLWFVRALAELGRGTSAVELLEMLSPINHARTPAEIAVYQAEPYVIAADVYSQPPHAGRAGWTWYTGSAGWMFRVAVESVLGLGIEKGRVLTLDPSISADWPACRLTYRLPGQRGAYEIDVANPHGRERGVRSAALDGNPVPVENGMARIPLVDDGRTHCVKIVL